MELQDMLGRAAHGGGLLFCGAGYAADCLNFDNIEEIGTSGALLTALNEKLEESGHTSGFRDLKNAADEYKEQKGMFSLMTLMKERFSIANVTETMIDIAAFPWDRIYTTNYDDAIEQALTRAGQPHQCINNLERTNSISSNRTPIIHLHGCINKWDTDNFDKSCVLGAESYLRIRDFEHWLQELRVDIERATVIIFVGSSARDFHLQQVLFNASGIRSKVYFVNREGDSHDPDIMRTQEVFGTPLFIGNHDFAKIIRSELGRSSIEEPVLRSFYRYSRPNPASDVPSVTDIEDLFIFGQFSEPHFLRDVAEDKSEYHVLRSIAGELTEVAGQDSAVILLTGEICNGKTIVMSHVRAQLSMARPVYVARHAYEDLLEETARILSVSANAVLIIENCFDLSQPRLMGLARQFSGSQATLLLTSRSIAAEAETEEVRQLEELSSFRKFRLDKLNEGEIDALIDLTDQIAGWRQFWGVTRGSRRRFVASSCGGSLPAFLLRLLRSQYVKERYRQEYSKTAALNPSEIRAVIAALYVSHIGHDASVSFLSNVFEYDVGAMIDRLSGQRVGFRLVRREGDRVRTVPSIGATNILRDIVEPQDVVDAIVDVLKRLARQWTYDEFTRHLFTQMMRYSILSAVVDDAEQVNRFFDNVAKIEYCRRRVLFWLQWHMAKTDQEAFVEAEKYLQQSYKEAEDYESRTGNRYDRKQLDDRRAKFLMIRGRKRENGKSSHFRDYREACGICSRLLRSPNLTHHPYETLREIFLFLEQRGQEFDSAQLEAANSMLGNLVSVGERRLRDLHAGYQSARAIQSLRDIGQDQEESG